MAGRDAGAHCFDCVGPEGRNRQLCCASPVLASAAALALHNSPDAASSAVAVDNGFERSGDPYSAQMSRGANAAYINTLPTGPAANIGGGGAAPAANGGGLAKVLIDVQHLNVPHGVTMKAASNSPGVTINRLKIVRAMEGHA